MTQDSSSQKKQPAKKVVAKKPTPKKATPKATDAAPKKRGRPPVAKPKATMLPAGLAYELVHTLHLSNEEIAGLSLEEAQRRIEAHRAAAAAEDMEAEKARALLNALAVIEKNDAILKQASAKAGKPSRRVRLFRWFRRG